MRVLGYPGNEGRQPGASLSRRTCSALKKPWRPSPSTWSRRREPARVEAYRRGKMGARMERTVSGSLCCSRGDGRVGVKCSIKECEADDEQHRAHAGAVGSYANAGADCTCSCGLASCSPP
eukprot:scaffold62873_cov30-Tisochrysis_lutea.AAC.2